MSLNRVVISGGGTGGHIYPAIAIANEIKRQNSDVEILFIGAKGKMEMEKVPLAGFTIYGLSIVGFNRKNILKNVFLPMKLLISMFKALRIIKRFKPQLVIGVGGYASGPTLKVATWLSIPTLIQEQNSFPGKTNMLLSKKVNAICVAYPNMEQFFPKEKIKLTGNPIRKDLHDLSSKTSEGFSFYGLNPGLKTVFIMGGSLGAKSINKAVEATFIQGENLKNIQVLWQCGKGYFHAYQSMDLPDNIKLLPFIERMDLAYAVADVIVSRAGATSISELSLVGKPCILVPSPNVSEDHQTKNAMALSSRNAAVLIPDAKIKEELWNGLNEIFEHKEKAADLSSQITLFARPEATEHIVSICNEIISNGQ